ncbi:MAG: MFS transporter [Ktedonobacteraceae bacterium]|nr:MFS transporter [Ktedonobacteraceae bacterium]
MSLEVEKPDKQDDFSGCIPEVTVAVEAPKHPGLLINRNFTLLWLGQTISIIGDYVFDTTLLLWVATSISRNQPWAPLAVSGIFIMASLPVFLIGPIAGVFVDRWPKRRTMICMDVARALLITILLIAALSGRLPASWELGFIYAVVFITNACSQFFNPARLVLIGDIVAAPERARATGRLQMAVSLATIFGPVLATVLYSTVGVYIALALNALSFVISLLAIWAIRLSFHREQREKTTQRRAFWAEFREGLAFCMHNRILTTVIVALVVSLFGIGSVNGLAIFFVEQNLHAPAGQYSILVMAIGIGTAIGAVVGGMVAQRLGLIRTLWLALLAMSAIFFVFSRLTSFTFAVIVIFFLGFPIAAFNVALMPLVLKIVPRELVGRVAAVINPLQSLSLLFSIFVAGTLVSTVLAHFHLTFLGITFGPVDTIYTAVAALVLIAGLYAMVNLSRASIEAEVITSSLPDEQ